MDGGLFKPRYGKRYKDPLQLNPKSRPCSERFFGKDDVSIARVASPAGQVEVINAHPESYGGGSLNVIRHKDYLMLVEYNLTDLRMKPTFAVKVDKKGQVVKKVSTLDFILDNYPHDSVVLTRTMSHGEKKMWKNPRTSGKRLGSQLMKMMMRTEHKHLCTAAGGFWNDAFVFWQDQVAFKLSKPQLKRMVQQGKAYITPLGYEYDRLSRKRVEGDLLIPFEFTTIHPTANKTLQRAYLNTS